MLKLTDGTPASSPEAAHWRENARLRSTNHHLAENLELAIANIQRLTLDNHQLRQRLEATTSITRIDNRHRPSVSISRPQ